MSTPAIEIENLSVTFDDRPVLRGFSLRVDYGETVVLTGPSGSGKSTVLGCVLGFVLPETGIIRVDGEAVAAESIWAIRRKLAFVAQEPDLGPGRVREVLARPFRFKANMAMKDNLQRLDELMSRFRLPGELLEKDIRTLSGGEKQRVALIAAILLRRRIFLLDEASSALDKASKAAVADYFRAERDVAVLSISHDTTWFDFNCRTVEMPALEGR